MIKLKLTKDKFIALINSVTAITECLRNNKKDLTGWPLMHANAHLMVLEELSRKMRSKLVLMEYRPGTYTFTWSINEIQALVFITNKGIFNPDPYTLAIIEEISSPFFRKLSDA